ncbi:MAG TPA: DinB family protein [Acidimicrobiales bacterium]|jgi:uncharacterized damage-inducible protein DinB|nr:DinB family protein [Acidimicrobiales bacterium]
MTMTADTSINHVERADFLQTLQGHRQFLRYTVQGLSDEQARQRTTASQLTLGGLLKHVTRTESAWADFIAGGAAAMVHESEGWTPEAAAERWASNFEMQPGETLAGLLAAYDEVARRTDEMVTTLPDLDASHALPEAPWFPPGAHWSARRVLLHVVAETSQHAGHADIIRESLDGQKTMG